jgi:hypothetical protein
LAVELEGEVSVGSANLLIVSKAVFGCALLGIVGAMAYWFDSMVRGS